MPTAELDELRSYAFDPWIYAASVVVYLALRILSRTVESIDNPKLSIFWRRIIPIVPPLLAVPIALHGDIPLTANRSTAVQVAVGLWISYLAEKAHKVLGQTILGDDALIERALTKVGLAKASASSKPPSEVDKP